MTVVRAHEFVSLDGVFESPSWTAEFGFDPAMGQAIGALTAPADAILLGRTTYEMFAPAWRDRSPDDDPGVPFFNDTEKYVVGGSPLVEEWANTTAIGGYDAAALRELKESRAGDVYVSGSGRLVSGLLADGLLDELHLFVYPVVLGSGARLFGEGRVPLSLLATEAYANGVLHLTYAPA